MILNEYSNGGFEQNAPDYVINDLEFVGTCGSFPEQYDVVLSKGGKRYQVGYVRLRGGRLSCSFPDVAQEEIYYCNFEDKYMGSFDTEETRLYYLNKIANKIIVRLEGKNEVN